MKLPNFIPREVLTTVGGWINAANFLTSSLILATLITAYNRDLHFNFHHTEETTRYFNQVLALFICGCALLESVLIPSNVLDGHKYSHSFFHLTKIAKNARVGFYMLALSTVEPHVFNMFFDEIKASVENDNFLQWNVSHFLRKEGIPDQWMETKFLLLEQGVRPSLYSKFVESDFEYSLIFSRMYMFVGGLIMLAVSVFYPSDTSWDATIWGNGNQRWYEKANKNDPDFYWNAFSSKINVLTNVCVAVFKGAIPVLAFIFHYTEYVQHRDDPAHDNVEAKYGYWDPFHLNHVVHSFAMLALAAYLILDAFGHLFPQVVNPKHIVRNYKPVHLFTLFMHVWLVSTMVDANGEESDNGEKYVFTNWVFLAGHLSCYVFQEFGIAPSVIGDPGPFFMPFRYALKFIRMLLFTERLSDSYMNLLQTTATVAGLLSIVLLVIGINGPWFHAVPLPGTITRDITNMLHETEDIIEKAHRGIEHLINDLEDSDIFQHLTCSFDDSVEPDFGRRGHDYMTCKRDDLKTWLPGQWHPCDNFRDVSKVPTTVNLWDKVNIPRLGSLADQLHSELEAFEISNGESCSCTSDQILQVGQGVDDACPCMVDIVQIVKANTGGSNDVYGNHNYYLDSDNNEVSSCPDDGSVTCYCDKNTGWLGTEVSGATPTFPEKECVIPAGLTAEFYTRIFAMIMVQNKDTRNQTFAGDTCTTCDQTDFARTNENRAAQDPPLDPISCSDLCGHYDEIPTGYSFAEDMFETVRDAQTSPFFKKGTLAHDPVEFLKNMPNAQDRWKYLFGARASTDQGGAAAFGHSMAKKANVGELDATRPDDAHVNYMEAHNMDSDCMRECNECPSSMKNCENAKHTLDENDAVNCGITSWYEDLGRMFEKTNPIANAFDGLMGFACDSNEFKCECYLACDPDHPDQNCKNKGLVTQKNQMRGSNADQDIGFCKNMKRCYHDDDEWSIKNGQNKDAFNHMRYVNNNSSEKFHRESSTSAQWNEFFKTTQHFYTDPPKTVEESDPRKRSGSDWERIIIADNPNYNGAQKLAAKQIKCFDDPFAEGCALAQGELDNFVGSTLMSAHQQKCRQTQCDVFIAMLAIVLIERAKAFFEADIPFYGGPIADATLIGAKILEIATRMLYRFFQFGMKIVKYGLIIYKRFTYFQAMLKRWTGFLLFSEIIVELEMRMMLSFIHVIGIGSLSFFIGFWRRQRIAPEKRGDIFNMFLVFALGGVLLGLCVTLFLALSPWAINWLIDEVLTFHHTLDFLKDALLDIELREDVGYVFLILSSLCATYSCLLWSLLLLKQKEKDIRNYILNRLMLGAPYEFKDSWVSRFTGSRRNVTRARTTIGSWFQTGVWMFFIAYIFYTTVDLRTNDKNQWVVKGAVFNVHKSTNSTLLQHVTDFFKTGSIATPMGGIDEEHSTLCDIIGSLLKELFLSFLKFCMEMVASALQHILQNFIPNIHFLYSIIKTDLTIISFDAYHSVQLISVFAPPLTLIILWLMGVTGSLLGSTPTATVWLRHLMLVVSISGIAYSISLQTIASSFDQFKIPLFGYTINFTTAIFKSQICCILGMFSWLQWRFDEIVPPCYTEDCGEGAAKSLVIEQVPYATPVSSDTPSSKLRLRMSSLA